MMIAIRPRCRWYEVNPAMFEDLRPLAEWHAELLADQARLEAQSEAETERRAHLERDGAGLKAELEQERARVADLKAEGEHQAQAIDRLSAELEQARRPW